MDAQNTASLSKLTRIPLIAAWHLFRTRIAELYEKLSPFKGQIEIYEPYFGGESIKNKRCRSAFKKTPVFAIHKRGGKVYTEIAPDWAKASLQGIIIGRVDPDSVIDSDRWRRYDGLVDLGYKKNYRVSHNKNKFAKGHSHINGIKSFCSYAKRHLMKFHGIADRTFYLHLKKCEFRFNNRNKNIYLVLRKMLRTTPLFY